MSPTLAMALTPRAVAIAPPVAAAYAEASCLNNKYNQ